MIDPDAQTPGRQEQLGYIENARELLVKVKAAEPNLRRQGCEQIAREVSMADSEVDRFVDGMLLSEISLHGSGELHYRHEQFFPGELVTVYFDEDMDGVEAEVYTPGKEPGPPSRR